MVAALAAAAAEGDRSENAEYTYRKKQLAGIDRRIRYLEKRLPNLTVVDGPPPGNAVRFGAWVTLAGVDGEVQYRIVGADEIDHADENISVDAPLARALIGKTVGQQISAPHDEKIALRILAITYRP